jgi:hypothetical protein
MQQKVCTVKEAQSHNEQNANLFAVEETTLVQCANACRVRTSSGSSASQLPTIMYLYRPDMA